MGEPSCANCGFRARHDRNPRSLLGRLWRWHANWCPGFKAYLRSLPEAERQALVERYGLARRRRHDDGPPRIAPPRTEERA